VGQTHVWGWAVLRLAPGVRAALDRRCAGRCEGCGLAWPWALYVFRVDDSGRCSTSNLAVLCLGCSAKRAGDFAPLVGARTLRDRVLLANNLRNGTAPMKDAARKKLIAARGGACEVCGAPADVRALEVHHRQPVLQGGDDREENLQVLCFACHHRLQPCSTGCGAWASKRSGVCRHCQTRRALERLLPEATWDEIKLRFPGFVQQWKPGYEPLPMLRYSPDAPQPSGPG